MPRSSQGRGNKRRRCENIVVEQMKTKSTKPTVTPDADKLARYIKELKSRAKLEKVMKKLREGHPNSKARGNTK